jgi:hypothetical protein
MIKLKSIVLKENVDFKRSQIANAEKYLEQALKTVSNTNDKYQILIYIVLKAMNINAKNQKSIWDFLSTFAKNILKGTGFRSNTVVIQELEKDPKWK